MTKSRQTLRTAILAGVGIIAVALSGCAAGGDISNTGTATAFPESDCAAGVTTADHLMVGTILPITGTLAFLNPPEQSGVGLAVADINAAGGVNGVQACILETDSGDSTDLSVSTAGAQELITARVSFAIGAASSSVSQNIVDSFTSAEIVQISPANTDSTLSGISPYYWRTAPPDTVQGTALGQLITGEGNQRVSFIVLNDTYGTGLRDNTQLAIESSGGVVIYGGTGNGQEFPPGQTTFSAEVTAAMAGNPDAIVIIAFEETRSIIPELIAQNWSMPRTFMTDGNTADYSSDFTAGTLSEGQGTIPGANPNDAFKSQLTSWYAATQGGTLNDFTYGAEAYDATTLAALAAVKARSNVSADIRNQLAAVSGARGGTECTSFAECAPLVTAGTEIRYVGQAGTGPFNASNDPSSAFIGIYRYDGENRPVFQSAVEIQAPA
jgi:neutral amino acid transport system substrate-binding protein